MSMMTRPRGTFVVSWSQTAIDGCPEAPETSLLTGATWQWAGDAVRLDGASLFRPDLAGGCADALRAQIAEDARRIVERALIQDGSRAPFVEDIEPVDRTFRLTNGSEEWIVTLLDVAEIARPLLLFIGDMPPADFPLYVAEGITVPARPSLLRPVGEGVVCFTPGTKLETPDGLRNVEELVAGDRVVTKDGGAQEVLWIGHRHVSGARLYAMPDLRPVLIRSGAIGNDRPTDDLVVSPDHRILVKGAAALALWGEPEVWVAARDLIDDRGITRDFAAKSASYVHLMLPAHHVLVANGVETESFHPGATDLGEVDEAQLARLFDVMPSLAEDPSSYGPMSRPVLSPAEAAILTGATGR